MASLLQRPTADFDPSMGLLRTEHFQLAYATNDIDRACEVMRDRLGIAEFRTLEGKTPAGGTIRVELAWAGPIMYEILTATGPGSGIYIGGLDGPGFAMRHHHCGFLLHDEGQWQGVLAEAERSGFAIPHVSETPGFMRSCFVDVPEFGHYLEFLWPTAAGLEFFANVPAN
ncbi:hypothetical protein [Novosphingobium beihaiensis]|uniref:VOC domain-containing protein n=1 Tax=Novosphingobium beihaiensis TaxID=2930389 RepID=A0ABT0BVF2_9SPHN|nr:hypothetical protein [Novosphingobium beihaiensis]MCJ2189019.1 hypothetical protein [Novosphingobium beihaiensis]